MRRILFHYLPYGAVDILLTVTVVVEFITQRYELLWTNIPVLIWGIISMNRKIKLGQNGTGD